MCVYKIKKIKKLERMACVINKTKKTIQRKIIFFVFDTGNVF